MKRFNRAALSKEPNSEIYEEFDEYFMYEKIHYLQHCLSKTYKMNHIFMQRGGRVVQSAETDNICMV